MFDTSRAGPSRIGSPAVRINPLILPRSPLTRIKFPFHWTPSNRRHLSSHVCKSTFEHVSANTAKLLIDALLLLIRSRKDARHHVVSLLSLLSRCHGDRLSPTSLATRILPHKFSGIRMLNANVEYGFVLFAKDTGSTRHSSRAHDSYKCSSRRFHPQFRP